MKAKIFPYKLIDANVEALNAKHHTTSKVLYLAVIFFLIAVVVALPYIKVNISTQSRGILKTEQQNNPINSGIYSQINGIFIAENQEVSKGDTIAILNSSKLEEQISLNQEKIKENHHYVRDLQQLIQKGSATDGLYSSLYNHEFIQYQQRIAEQELKLNYTKNALERANKLINTGTIAKNEHEQARFEYEMAASTLKVFKEQQRKTWQFELNKYKAENRELSSQIEQIQKDKKEHIITAPIDGIITQYSGIQAGNFISPNQPIAYISSTNELLVENYVSPSDIGLIQEGMRVKFQIDAFNYNQWGIVEGTVKSVSGDITTVQDQPFFIVRCALDRDYLSLTNGYKGTFKKGMTLTSRFSITERTLYQLLYDKMDDWLNPLQTASL